MPPATVEAVYASINAAYRYQPDAPGRDEWRTPAEFMAAGGGDCEDFAIAYWHALRHQYDHGQARIACCYRAGKQMHMVCLYYPPGDTDPQVLDVAVDAVCRLSERPDLVVLYELDANGIHSRGHTRPVTHVAPWAGVLARMAQQGAWHA